MRKPDYRSKRIYELDINELKNSRIKLILADMDNTLAYWRTDTVENNAVEWVKRATASGIEVVLFSNSKGKNVDSVGKKFNISVYKNAKKPFVKNAKKLLEEKKIAPFETLIAGDQLFTDLLLANKLGARCALLEPLDRREWWCTKLFNRTRERLVWKKMFNEEYFR